MVRSFLKPIAMPLAQLLMPNLIQRLEQLNDWAQLGIYQTENQELSGAHSEDDRVVFFGDSITEFWDLAATFPGKPYINRGIAGQTTPQMLVRFRPDVISLQPKVVIILSGTNDIAGNTGYMTLDMITNNYRSMADLARANDIHVVFASILPIHDHGTAKQSDFRSPAKIQALNDWLTHYCYACGHLYLDYFSPLIDDNGMLKAELSDDGVHPNQQGYTVMAAFAKAAIQQCAIFYAPIASSRSVSNA